MSKKEEILQMYFEEHKKQEIIAENYWSFTKLYISSSEKRHEIY